MPKANQSRRRPGRIPEWRLTVILSAEIPAPTANDAALKLSNALKALEPLGVIIVSVAPENIRHDSI